MKTQIIIVGAGPVGLTLAVDLGRRGIACVLVEQKSEPQFLPKMERCNARTMEIFRRLGLVERIRAAGMPEEVPMDIQIIRSMAEPPVLRLPYPSVAQARALARESHDGHLPLEPYELISQPTLEPLLLDEAEQLPPITVLRSTTFLDFTEQPDGVLRKSNEMIGAELGYRYVDSPVIDDVPGGPQHDVRAYFPTAWPGARLPDMWLGDGRAIQDRLRPDLALIDVAQRAIRDHEHIEGCAEHVERAVKRSGIVDTRDIHRRVAVRPDMHVAWRGDLLPQAVSQLAARVTGHRYPVLNP